MIHTCYGWVRACVCHSEKTPKNVSFQWTICFTQKSSQPYPHFCWYWDSSFGDAHPNNIKPGPVSTNNGVWSHWGNQTFPMSRVCIYICLYTYYVSLIQKKDVVSTTTVGSCLSTSQGCKIAKETHNPSVDIYPKLCYWPLWSIQHRDN